MASGKSKSHSSVANPLETGIEAVRSIGKPTKKWIADEGKQSGKTFLEQLLGLNLTSKKEPIKADAPQKEKPQVDTGLIEIFNLTFHKQLTEKKGAKTEQRPRAEAAIDYHRDIVKSSERASKGETREMNQNIEQIKIELSKLVASSQVLKLEFAEIGVDMTPNVGQYHLNFFEWMLAVIRSARQKVEDSGNWLQTVKGKGAKRGYWGMFKKHGTTFGLSGERAVATQVG